MHVGVLLQSHLGEMGPRIQQYYVLAYLDGRPRLRVVDETGLLTVPALPIIMRCKKVPESLANREKSAVLRKCLIFRIRTYIRIDTTRILLYPHLSIGDPSG